MTDETLALLDGTVAVLRETAPTLPGDGRYAALLCASAVATARRRLAARARAEAARVAVAVEPAAIRAGAHDDDAALYERLVAHAAIRAWIADPSSLTEAETAAHLGGAP